MDGGGRKLRSVRGLRNRDQAFDDANEFALSEGRGRARFRLFPRPRTRPASPFPRFTGTALALAFLAASGAYAISLAGETKPVVESLTTAMGFGINAVRITGQKEINEADVLTVLAIPKGASLIGYDAEDARRRLQHMSWIDSVAVMKLYPSTLQVTIKERQPFALWQRGQVVSVVDREGAVITDVVGDRFVRLPRAVGHGAQHRLAEIIDDFDGFEALKSKVRAYILIADRRWNLRLDNGIDVLLPETGVRAALAELQRLDSERGLFARDITRVDLRLPDKVVVRLSEDAQEKFDAEVKESDGRLRRRRASL